MLKDSIPAMENIVGKGGDSLDAKETFQQVLTYQFPSLKHDVRKAHFKVEEFFGEVYELMYFTNPFSTSGVDLYYFFNENIVKASWSPKEEGPFSLSAYPRKIREKRLYFDSFSTKDSIVELILESGDVLSFKSKGDSYEDFRDRYPNFVEDVFRHA